MGTTTEQCSYCGEGEQHYVLTICVRNLNTKNTALTKRIEGLRTALDNAIDGFTALGRCPNHPCAFCGAIAMSNREAVKDALADDDKENL